jgi:hypothetical protein
MAIVEADDDDDDSDVETGDGDSGVDSWVVQFSHFSVKEFLTSSRLSTTSGEVSAYRIDLGNAHTILAQACPGVLLQTHDEIDGNTVHPRIIRWLNTLPSTGLLMPNLGRSRHACR